MVTRVLPPPCTGVKSQDWKLGFGKSLSIVRICDLTSLRSAKRIVFVIRNSNQGSDLAELQPASEGIPLLVPREKYSESLHKTVRRKTRTVMVGNVALGSEHPIRIQTMTTSDTKDVAGTVEEVMRIADRGADIVRITVQGKKEADACFEIKDKLVQLNYNIPLVVDIYFAPSVALRVAECFDKIRVNPENFADRWSQFETIEYTEDEYQKELQHIEQVFTPLVEKCKKYGRAMRIGTKLGSLSDRIMSYYGDSPRGMVESAFEFARICRKLDYHNFVFSMKASNPVIMVQAYRLRVAEMYVHGWDYPLHLGDTEAGEGEDGRMKSAIGIGTLLQDGLGDTISVSLTEPPEEEIDPCRRLANLGTKAAELQQGVAPFEEKHRHYFDFQPVQKEGEEVDYRGVLHRDGSVLMSISLDQLKAPELLYRSLATKLVVGKPFKDLPTVDSVLLRELPPVVHPATEAYTQEATEAIKSEKVIAVPTDTLYGFACDACSLEAVNRIYEIKGRKLTSPLAICVGDVLDIKRVATTNHLPHGLLDSLLPGPVTLILHRGDSSILEKSLNPGIDTIGVRVPDCEFIREVSRGSGSVLALTSANLSGDRSSVCVNDFENLWQHCAYVYDGGLLPSGRAGSAIIDLTKSGKYKIIRPGSSKQATVAILGKYMLEEEEEDG